MMNLQAGHVIVFKLSELLSSLFNQSQENVHSNREVCSIHKSVSLFVNDLSCFFDSVVPASRPDHEVLRTFCNSPEIREDFARDREVDAHVYALQGFGSQARSVA